MSATNSFPPKLLSLPISVTTIAYGFACAILLVGGLAWFGSTLDLDLLGQTSDTVVWLAEQFYRLTGWTAIAFVPLLLVMVYQTIRRVFFGPFDASGVVFVDWLMGIATAVGMAGTLWGFVCVGYSYKGDHAVNPTAALSAILVGMGSTFIAACICLWGMLLLHRANHSASTSNPNPAQ